MAALARLAVLPQGLCLPNALWLLEPCLPQGPSQGIETSRPHPTGGTRRPAPHGPRILAGTAIIPILIALTDAQLPRRWHVPRALATADKRPQAIPLRRGLICAARFDVVLFARLLGFGKGLCADAGWRREGPHASAGRGARAELAVGGNFRRVSVRGTPDCVRL
jgi:hypothetical protein